MMSIWTEKKSMINYNLYKLQKVWTEKPGWPLTMQGWEFDLSIFDLLIFFIFKKDQPWSNRSRQSLKMIDHERMYPDDLLKRSMGGIRSFSQSNRSINHKKKQLIRSKNRWSNSQPWTIDCVVCMIGKREYQNDK